MRLRWAFCLLTAALAAGVVFASSEGAVLTDRTVETGLDFEHFNGMSGELYFPEVFGPGAALFDYDGDGDLDAYLVQGQMLGDDTPIEKAVIPPPYPPPLKDRLFRNDSRLGPTGNLESHFVDVTEASGLEALGYGMGVTVGDLDNDGFPDIYLTNFGDNQMLRNNGDGTFTDITAESATNDRRWSVAALFVDYDYDGLLDLYLGNFVKFRLATHKKCSSSSGTFDYCAPISYEPEGDRLFHNRGGGAFDDVSTAAGIDGEYGGALGLVAADFNGDGWVDIYVANDGLPNLLWINQHDGTFLDEAILGGCAVNEKGLPEASMGVVSGDFDGDGSEDLFMSHLAEETNTFYLNDGRGLFREATRDSQLGLPSWQYTGFGTSLSDYDNDGWPDLFVVNGAVKRIEPQLRAGNPHPLDQINQLYRNLGGAIFEEVTARAGPVFETAEVTRGLATGDLDQDGDSDYLISNNAGPARVLFNEIGQDASWLGVRVLSGRLNRDALGARLALVREGQPSRWRRIATDGSYASSSDPRVIIGLGGDRQPQTLRVYWPRGPVQEFRNQPVGRYLVVTEGPGW